MVHDNIISITPNMVNRLIRFINKDTIIDNDNTNAKILTIRIRSKRFFTNNWMAYNNSHLAVLIIVILSLKIYGTSG